MTRVNLIPAKQLTDQHLQAEKKELNQLAGQMKKSLASLARRNANLDSLKIPPTFKLGSGHVKFFYNKGPFIRRRWKEVYDELINRKFKPTGDLNDVWGTSPEFNIEWTPTAKDIKISQERIEARISLKPWWYRYYSKPIV